MSIRASNCDRVNIQVSHNGIDLCWRVSPYFISGRNESSRERGGARGKVSGRR